MIRVYLAPAPSDPVHRRGSILAPYASLIIGLLLVAALSGCDSADEPPQKLTSTRTPPAGRLVAIGDLHGDLAATRAALRMAGAVDGDDRWIGRDTVVVQLGDQLDRGDDELEILALLDRLADEAEEAGGAVHVLNGNHEIMNVLGDFRYVTRDAFADFSGLDLEIDDFAPGIARVPPEARARWAAFRPGTELRKLFAERKIVLLIGENLFLHGGLTPFYAEYGLERMNAEAQAWLSGLGGKPPKHLVDEFGPLWYRGYSRKAEADTCARLERALDTVSAKRMIVGHTIQKDGITAACDGKIWRIDVGMSAAYGGEPEVLEITGDQVRIIK